MGEKLYKIFMKTPIGIRVGSMTCEVEGETVSGYLNLLNRSESFSGKIDEKGHCVIKGRIVTLMRNMLFDAEGEIYDDYLFLSLKAGRNNFEITGSPLIQKEVQPI